MRRFYSMEYNGLCDFGTDLALERRRADTECEGIRLTKDKINGFLWERLEVNSYEGEKELGRPRGNYDTLTTMNMDMMDEGEIEDAAEEIAKELVRLCDINRIRAERILVVGLGNRSLTPDALGPRVCELINPTMHIKELDEIMFGSLGCMEIAVVAPGTLFESGLDASDTVKALCALKTPDLVIAVDALCARSKERLGRTVQICDTGVFPGSGMGKGRIPLNEQTLKSPVIAIGIPTVINSDVFLMNAERSQSTGKMSIKADSGMFVSPKDIDIIVKNGAKIIALAINQAFGIAV